MGRHQTMALGIMEGTHDEKTEATMYNTKMMNSVSAKMEAVKCNHHGGRRHQTFHHVHADENGNGATLQRHKKRTRVNLT